MQLLNYISFLKNKNIKVKLSFILIIFLSIIIVIVDALSIFSLLPFTSLIFDIDAINTQDQTYQKYLPLFLRELVKEINSWVLFIISSHYSIQSLATPSSFLNVINWLKSCCFAFECMLTCFQYFRIPDEKGGKCWCSW